MGMLMTKLRYRSLDYSGRELAALADVPPSRISEWSLGRKAIPIGSLIKLAQVLKCSPEDITGWIDVDQEATFKLDWEVL